VGIYHGYDGLIDSDFKILKSADVSNIIQKGGTVLKSSRSERFRTKEGRELAYKNVVNENIDALVAIGGDGTFTGADVFLNEFDIPIIGIPGTIDNDLYGTDFTIGYDTAINTVIRVVDQLRDTADSLERLFIVEVMGRDAGFIALRTGVASGAEAMLIPESKTDMDRVIETLDKGWQRKKSSSIIVVAEGDDAGGAFDVAKKIQEKFDHYTIRVSILGHIQRGGTPTCMDRVLASRLGVRAVELLLKGEKNVMVGVEHRDIIFTPFENAVKHHKEINLNLLRIAEILSV